MKRVSCSVVKKCECGTQFTTTTYKLEAGRGKYCSQTCKYKYRTRPTGLVYKIVSENRMWINKGQRLGVATEFKPGIRNNMAGEIKKGQRVSVKTEFKKGCIPLNYKGDSVGYHALHRWVSRHKGKAAICRQCGTCKNVQWANLSHEYRRELTDYVELCSKCHRGYDMDYLGAAAKKFNHKYL